MSPTDSELIDAVLRGEKEAFSQLAERYENLLRYVIARHTVDAMLAQDLLQETLLEAYLSLDTLQEKSSFRSWICAIARHICLMSFRRRRIQTVSLDVYGGIALDQALWGESVEETAERSQLRWVIRQAVRKLSDRNREVVALFYFEDFSLEETAAALGLTANTVKGRLHRARQQLRAALEHHLLIDEPLISGASTMSETTTMIPVQLIDVILREFKSESGQTHSQYLLTLFEAESHRAFVIWVGEFEGLQIATQMNGQQTPRPMTHFLMSRLVEATGATLERIEISSLREEVYYATIVLNVNGETVRVDARPSDALGIAVYTGTPLFADQSVLDKAGFDVPAGARPTRAGLQEIEAVWQQRREADAALRQQMQAKSQAGLDRDYEEETRQVLSKIFSVGG
jgi:RNA polymerase sigma factor (sigma-70 family)